MNPAVTPTRPLRRRTDHLPAGRLTVSRTEHRWYVLGAPAAARLVQCVAAARAGRRVAAILAGALAGVSLVASLLAAVLLLAAGWLAAQHRDVNGLVLPVVGLLLVTGMAGMLAELPRLEPSDRLPTRAARPVAELADAVLALGHVALAFGRTNRATYHPSKPDGDPGEPESDTDHTVMLALIACAVAADQPGLDIGLIAQYAVVHDLVEVYAGDVPTLRALSAAAKADKKRREVEAYERLRAEFGEQLPWLPTTIHHYERQDTPEARFVRAVDKLMPKLTHLPNHCRTLHEQGTTIDELAARYTQQREEELAGYAADFPLVLALHAELAGRVVATYRQQELADLSGR